MEDYRLAGTARGRSGGGEVILAALLNRLRVATRPQPALLVQPRDADPVLADARLRLIELQQRCGVDDRGPVVVGRAEPTAQGAK